MKTKITEEQFLNDLTGRPNSAIYLVSGICLRGTIASHDGEVVFLRGALSSRSRDVQMIMKTAIATITADG
ncbi:RNA chaperone Hfq [Povalibacter sp.]|uniref:RNA chaperone Hfq n=1 Tax=Povalibacter sp. TaxID=1962978 RepID=UPI002F425094